MRVAVILNNKLRPVELVLRHTREEVHFHLLKETPPTGLMRRLAVANGNVTQKQKGAPPVGVGSHQEATSSRGALLHISVLLNFVKPPADRGDVSNHASVGEGVYSPSGSIDDHGKEHPGTAADCDDREPTEGLRDGEGDAGRRPGFEAPVAGRPCTGPRPESFGAGWPGMSTAVTEPTGAICRANSATSSWRCRYHPTAAPGNCARRAPGSTGSFPPASRPARPRSAPTGRTPGARTMLFAVGSGPGRYMERRQP